MEAIKNYLAQIDEKHLVFIISFLLLLSPILYINTLQNPSHAPRIALLSIAAVIGVVFYLFRLWKSKSKLYFHKVHILVLAFLLWATISITWTIDFGNFAYEIIPLWSLVGLFFISSHIATINNIKFLIFISLIGACYAAIVALLQNYNLNPPYIQHSDYPMPSTFNFKNHFALYLDLIIPLSISLTVVVKNSILRKLLVVFTGLIIGTLLELHTRGSWLTLATWTSLSLVILFIFRRNCQQTISTILKRKYEILFIIIISSFISLSQGNIDKTWSRPAQQGKVLDQSSNDRLLMYYNSLSMIKDNPVKGVGYGAFWKGFREYMNHPLLISRSDGGNYVYRLHNDPLQYFTELGIPGGILVLTLFVFISYMGFRLFYIYTDSTHKIIVLGLLMSILACGGHSLIDFPLHKPSSAIQFWISLGLISGLYIKHFSSTSIPRKFYLILSLAITLLYSSVATAFHIKNIKGSYYHRQAKLSENCKDATRFIDLAVEEGEFFLLNHAQRVSTHIKCKTPTPQLLEIMNEELSWDPTNIKALYIRGQIMMHSGYPEQALNDFAKIIYILPHRSPAKIAAVKVLLKLNRKQEALNLVKKIIEQHPELEDVKKLLEEINQ